MSFKFNNLTTIENQVANSFLDKAEHYFLENDQHQVFSKFLNLFNSTCNNKTYNPNQFTMSFCEESNEVFTEEETSKINEYKKQLINQRI